MAALTACCIEEAAAPGAAGGRIYRTELQLLTAAPQSQSQIWHSDHRAHGLTLVVPLVSFTPDNGGTQVLPGSHAP